jgi:hypothetical protein
MNRFERISFRAALVIVLFIVASYLASDTLNIPTVWVDGDTLTAAKFNANSAAIEAIVNGQLSDVNIKSNGITASAKIIDETIDLAAMGANSVNSAKIVDDGIASVDILDGTVANVDVAKGATQNAVFSSASAGGGGSCIAASYAALNKTLCEFGSLTITTQATAAGPVRLEWGPANCDMSSSAPMHIHIERDDAEIVDIPMTLSGDNNLAGFYVDEGATANTAHVYDILWRVETGSSFSCPTETQYFNAYELRNDG